MKLSRATVYTQEAAKVFYDSIQEMVIPQPKADQNTIVFDSQWEFKVWYCLTQRDNLSIKVHQYVKHLNWYIDYLLDVKRSKALPSWLLDLDISPHKGREIYIDAKGTLDNRTVQRILNYPPRTQQRIILITPRKIIQNRLNAHILCGEEIGLNKWIKESPWKYQTIDGRIHSKKVEN